MGGKKMTLRASRMMKLFLLMIASILYVTLYSLYGSTYYMLITGSTLVVIVAILMSLSIIRRMPFFSLCNARFWSQTHIYLGAFSCVIFILHVDRGWPHGIFNTVLFVFFLLMIATGFFGLYCFRSVPKKLVFFGPEMLFEEMPLRYRQLRESAESALEVALGESECRDLKGFYMEHLFDYFCRPLNTWRFICGLSVEQQEGYVRELEMLKRYANEGELACIERLITLIRQKYDLDYCYAQKLLLKRWLYVHIPIAYLFVAFVIIHVTLVGIHFMS